MRQAARERLLPASSGLAGRFRLAAHSRLFGILTFLAITTAGVGGAAAQAIDCSAYRAELNGLSRGVDPRAQEYLVAAQRQRGELDRTRAYFNQIGCTRTDNFRTPGECAPLRAHMQQMQSNLNEMLAYADRLGGGPRNQARRRQLQAALDRHCANVPERPRGFFERIFGSPQESDYPPEMPQADVSNALPEAPREERASGGSQPVCVRLADGFFFPLGGPFQGVAQAQQVCQAQCPATRTELFFMSQGGTIERAQSASGVPYSSLPNARAYQKRLVPEAACLQQGETWEHALQAAQSLIAPQESDIVVTAEKARELSRPAGARSASRVSQADTAADAEDIADAAAVPTAGGESAGIGPGLTDAGATISRREGMLISATSPDGGRRNVRVVAPYLIPTPETPHRN